MAERSRDHHYVPKWLLKNFCIDGTNKVWVGSKETGKVVCSAPRRWFFRKDGNTRTDYIPDGSGNFERVRSGRDETILAELDDRTSVAANHLVQWARELKDNNKDSGPPPPGVVYACKNLVVVQARRVRESQNRMRLTHGLDDLLWDLYQDRAKEIGFELGAKDKLLPHPKVQFLFSDIEQNLRATFASGHDPILRDKEEKFLLETGLQIVVAASSGLRFVIGNQGITILNGSAGKVSWLPLAPDVAISLTARPNSCESGICSDYFVEQHNKCAFGMSRMIASDSKQTIDDLLGALDC